MPYQVFKFDPMKMNPVQSNLIYVTISKYDSNWHSTIHSHHVSEIFFIIDGSGVFLFRDAELTVTKNDVVIIHPNIPHTEKSNQIDSLEYIAFGVEGIIFNSPEQDSPYHFFKLYNPDKYAYYLRTLISEAKNQLQDYNIICQNLFNILITMLKRDYNIHVKHVEVKKINKDIALVQDFIQHHFREDITLSTLAEVAHLNKYHLAHIFKETVGVSPIEYLNRVRIQECKLLLETTDFSIQNIADFIGFSSQSYFTQVFKRMTGMTPSEYRKKKKREAVQ